MNQVKNRSKQTAEALKKFEFIVNGSRDFMTLINREYRYEAANSAFCGAQGLTVQEVLGKSVAEVWGKGVFARYIKKHLQQAFSGAEVLYEFAMRSREGKKKWFEAIYFPYKSPQGKITHVAVVSRDITERNTARDKLRKNQASLQAYSKRLEQTVAERTEKLSQLVDSQMEFIADISHELRTPLSVVRAVAESGEEDGGLSLGECEVISAKIDQVADLLRNLMLITRLDLGQGGNHVSEFGVVEVLEEAVSDALSEYEAGSAQVQIEGDRKVRYRADRSKLLLVAVNIVKNAVKYAADKPEIAIRVTRGKSGLKIEFEDANERIASRELAKIFGRFYRTQTARRASEGSGLGLYICRRLVESLAGNIKAEAGKRGNKFVVELPVGARET